VTYNTTACHLFFCRGYQLEDNLNNTRVYSPGTAVAFHVSIEAHHTGFAVRPISPVFFSRAFIYSTTLERVCGEPRNPDAHCAALHLARVCERHARPAGLAKERESVLFDIDDTNVGYTDSRVFFL
jgi:hypothetical protein